MTKPAVKKTTAKPRRRTLAQEAQAVKAQAVKAQSVTKTSIAALITVGACKTVKTVCTANQLAAALGLPDGKRLRGWLRQNEVLGNDGRYSHYGIDVNSKDGTKLVRRACERFKQDYNAVMTRLVKALTTAS